MRRTFALAPSTIALIVVALLVSSASIAVSLAGEVNIRLAAAPEAARATVDRADGRTTEPDGRARTLFLHTQAPSTGRVHAPHATGGDGARSTAALGASRASLDLAARHGLGPASDARRSGITSPGQPAPSSRAPPIG